MILILLSILFILPCTATCYYNIILLLLLGDVHAL